MQMNFIYFKDMPMNLSARPQIPTMALTNSDLSGTVTVSQAIPDSSDESTRSSSDLQSYMHSTEAIIQSAIKTAQSLSKRISIDFAKDN